PAHVRLAGREGGIREVAQRPIEADERLRGPPPVRAVTRGARGAIERLAVPRLSCGRVAGRVLRLDGRSEPRGREDPGDGGEEGGGTGQSRVHGSGCPRWSLTRTPRRPVACRVSVRCAGGVRHERDARRGPERRARARAAAPAPARFRGEGAGP